MIPALDTPRTRFRKDICKKRLLFYDSKDNQPVELIKSNYENPFSIAIDKHMNEENIDPRYV